MPRRASVSTTSPPAMMPSPEGPARIPTAMKETISGCRAATPTSPTIEAIARSAAIS